MPSNLSFLDNNFPSFTSETTTEQKLDTIQNYLYMTVESLRYALSHLNAGNMEQNFIDSIVESGSSYAEIKQQVDQNSANIVILSATQTSQGQAIATIEETVDEHGASISLVVDNNGIKAGAIIQSINGQSQATISADKVDLQGYVTFTNLSTPGQTTIDGGNIITNTLSVANIKCQGTALNVKDLNGVSIGSLGYETGMTSSGVTEGMAMKYDSTHYVICTSAGVRLQSGTNSIWVTDSGTSIGQAVFG